MKNSLLVLSLIFSLNVFAGEAQTDCSAMNSSREANPKTLSTKTASESSSQTTRQ